MTIKTVVRKIDNLICAYLGIKQEKTNPIKVKFIDNELTVVNTSSYKRHVVEESWENYSISCMKQTSPADQEKLGLALGKALANNLVVSFEDIPVREAGEAHD